MVLKEKVIAFVMDAYKNYAKAGITIDSDSIAHLNDVMNTVMTLSDDDDMICAAGLHDILERTEITPEKIADEFSETTSKIVTHINSCYHGNITGHENWLKEERNVVFRIESMPDFEKVIILADFLSNARNLVNEYSMVGEEIYDIYGIPKDEFIYFYQAVTQALNELSETKAWQEFDRLTSDIPFIFDEALYDNKWLMRLNCELRTSNIESFDLLSTRVKDQIMLLLLNTGVADDTVVPVISKHDISDYDENDPNNSFMMSDNNKTYYAILTRPFTDVKHTINMRLFDIFLAASENGVDAIVINPDDEHYVVVRELIDSIVYMSDKFQQGELTQNDDFEILPQEEDDDNVEYLVSINRPTDEYTMNAICHFIQQTKSREGESVLIKIKESKPIDGIKQIRVTSQNDSYMMELFYDMTDFQWNADLVLASEGLPYLMVEDLLNKLCVLGLEDEKIPFIMNNFRDITEEA